MAISTFRRTAVRVTGAVMLFITVLLAMKDGDWHVLSYCMSRPGQTVYSGMPLAQAGVYTPEPGLVPSATGDCVTCMQLLWPVVFQ